MTDEALTSALADLRASANAAAEPRPLPTEQQVDDAQAALGCKFPPEYRRYLLEASDVVRPPVEPYTIAVVGSFNDLRAGARDAWGGVVPRDQLPFCEHDGNYYCLTPEGVIRLWNKAGVTDTEWPDLASWIRGVWLT